MRPQLATTAGPKSQRTMINSLKMAALQRSHRPKPSSCSSAGFGVGASAASSNSGDTTLSASKIRDQDVKLKRETEVVGRQRRALAQALVSEAATVHFIPSPVNTLFVHESQLSRKLMATRSAAAEANAKRNSKDSDKRNNINCGTNNSNISSKIDICSNNLGSSSAYALDSPQRGREKNASRVNSPSGRRSVNDEAGSLGGGATDSNVNVVVAQSNRQREGMRVEDTIDMEVPAARDTTADVRNERSPISIRAGGDEEAPLDTQMLEEDIEGQRRDQREPYAEGDELLGSSTAQHPSYALFYNDSLLMVDDALPSPDFTQIVTTQEVYDVARQRRSSSSGSALSGEGSGEATVELEIGGGGDISRADLFTIGSAGDDPAVIEVSLGAFVNKIAPPECSHIFVSTRWGNIKVPKPQPQQQQSSSRGDGVPQADQQQYTDGRTSGEYGGVFKANKPSSSSGSVGVSPGTSFSCTLPSAIIDSHMTSLRALESGGAAFSVLLNAPDRTVQWSFRGVLSGYAVGFVRGLWEDPFSEERRTEIFNRIKRTKELEKEGVDGQLVKSFSLEVVRQITLADALLLSPAASFEGLYSHPSWTSAATSILAELIKKQENKKHTVAANSSGAPALLLLDGVGASVPSGFSQAKGNGESGPHEERLKEPSAPSSRSFQVQERTTPESEQLHLTPLDIIDSRLAPLPHGAPHVRCVYADGSGVLLHRNLSAAVCGTWGLKVVGGGGGQGDNSSSAGGGEVGAGESSAGVAIVKGVMDLRTWEPNTLESLLRPDAHRHPRNRLSRLVIEEASNAFSSSPPSSATYTSSSSLDAALSLLPDTATFATVPTMIDALLVPTNKEQATTTNSQEDYKSNTFTTRPRLDGGSAEAAKIAASFRAPLLSYLTTQGQSCTALDGSNTAVYALLERQRKKVSSPSSPTNSSGRPNRTTKSSGYGSSSSSSSSNNDRRYQEGGPPSVLPYVLPWGRPLSPLIQLDSEQGRGARKEERIKKEKKQKAGSSYPKAPMCRIVLPADAPSARLPPALMLPSRPLHEMAPEMPISGEFVWIPRSYQKGPPVSGVPVWVHSEEVEAEVGFGEAIVLEVVEEGCSRQISKEDAKTLEKKEKVISTTKAEKNFSSSSSFPRIELSESHLLGSDVPPLSSSVPLFYAAQSTKDAPPPLSFISPSANLADDSKSTLVQRTHETSTTKETSTFGAPTNCQVQSGADTFVVTKRRHRRCIVELELPTSCLMSNSLNQLITAVPRSPDLQEGSAGVRSLQNAPMMWSSQEYDLFFHLHELRLVPNMGAVGKRREGNRYYQQNNANAYGANHHHRDDNGLETAEEDSGYRVVMDQTVESVKRHALSFRNFRITHIDGVAIDQDYAESEGALRKLRTQSQNDRATGFQARFPLINDLCYTIYNREHTARSDVQKGTGSVGNALDRMTAQLMSNKGFWSLMNEKTNFSVISFWQSVRLPLEVLQHSLLGRTAGLMDLSGKGLPTAEFDPFDKKTLHKKAGEKESKRFVSRFVPSTERLWSSIRRFASDIWGMSPFPRVYGSQSFITHEISPYYDAKKSKANAASNIPSVSTSKGAPQRDTTTSSSSDKEAITPSTSIETLRRHLVSRPHFRVALRLLPRLQRSRTANQAEGGEDAEIESLRRALLNRGKASEFSSNLVSLASYSVTRRLYARKNRTVEDPALAFLSEVQRALLLKVLWDPRGHSDAKTIALEQTSHQLGIPTSNCDSASNVVDGAGNARLSLAIQALSKKKIVCESTNVSNNENNSSHSHSSSGRGGFSDTDEAYAKDLIPRRVGRALRDKWAHILYRSSASVARNNPHFSSCGGAFVPHESVRVSHRDQKASEHTGLLGGDVKGNRNRQAVVDKIWQSIERSSALPQPTSASSILSTLGPTALQQVFSSNEMTGATAGAPSAGHKHQGRRNVNGGQGERGSTSYGARVSSPPSASLRGGRGASPIVPHYDANPLLNLHVNANLSGSASLFRIRIQSDEPVELIAEMAKYHLREAKYRILAEGEEEMDGFIRGEKGEEEREDFVAMAKANGWRRVEDPLEGGTLSNVGSESAGINQMATEKSNGIQDSSVVNDNDSNSPIQKAEQQETAVLALGDPETPLPAAYSATPLRRLTLLQRDTMGVSLGLFVGSALPPSITLGTPPHATTRNKMRAKAATSPYWWSSAQTFHAIQTLQHFISDAEISESWGKTDFAYFLRPQFPIFVSGLLLRPRSGTSVFEKEVNAIRCELGQSPAIDFELLRNVSKNEVERSENFKKLKALISSAASAGQSKATSASSNSSAAAGQRHGTRVIEVKSLSSKDIVVGEETNVELFNGAICHDGNRNKRQVFDHNDILLAKQHNNVLHHVIRKVSYGLTLFAAGGGAGPNGCFALGDDGEGVMSGIFARASASELSSLIGLGALCVAAGKSSGSIESALSQSFCLQAPFERRPKEEQLPAYSSNPRTVVENKQDNKSLAHDALQSTVPLPASVTCAHTGAHGGNSPVFVGAKIADYSTAWQLAETLAEQLKPLVATSVVVIHGGGVSATAISSSRSRSGTSAATPRHFPTGTALSSSSTPSTYTCSFAKEGQNAERFYGHQLNTLRLSVTFTRRAHPAALIRTICHATRYLAKNRLIFDALMSVASDANDWSRVEVFENLREYRRLVSGASAERNDNSSEILCKSRWHQLADQRDHYIGGASNSYRAALRIHRVTEAGNCSLVMQNPSSWGPDKKPTYVSATTDRGQIEVDGDIIEDHESSVGARRLNPSMLAWDDPSVKADSISSLDGALSLNNAWARLEPYATREYFVGTYWEQRIRGVAAEAAINPHGIIRAALVATAGRGGGCPARKIGNDLIAKYFIFTHDNGCIPSPTAPWRFVTINFDLVDARLMSSDCLGVSTNGFGGPNGVVGQSAEIDRAELTRMLIAEVSNNYSSCKLSKGASHSTHQRRYSPQTNDGHPQRSATHSFSKNKIIEGGDTSQAVFSPSKTVPDTFLLPSEQGLAEELFGTDNIDTNYSSIAWLMKITRSIPNAVEAAPLTLKEISLNKRASSMQSAPHSFQDPSGSADTTSSAGLYHYARQGIHGRFVKAMILDSTLRVSSLLVEFERAVVSLTASPLDLNLDAGGASTSGISPSPLHEYSTREIEAQLALFVSIYGATLTDLLSSDMILDLVWGEPILAPPNQSNAEATRLGTVGAMAQGHGTVASIRRFRPSPTDPLQRRLVALLPTGHFRDSLPRMVSEESAVAAAVLMAHFAPCLWRAKQEIGVGERVLKERQRRSDDMQSKIAEKLWFELLPLVHELRTIYASSESFHATLATPKSITSSPHTSFAEHYQTVGGTELLEVFGPSHELKAGPLSLTRAYFGRQYAPREAKQ